MATPLEINIALWYYTRLGDYGVGPDTDHNFNAPAVQAAFQHFVDAGLLKRRALPDNSQQYYSTEGLTVYVEALCNVPWPEQKWVMPE